MKLNHSKDWYERHLALEGDEEVGAGNPPKSSAATAAAANIRRSETSMTFGTFIELWRRNQGWDAAKLAAEAGVRPAEILELEHNPQSEPEPDAVYRLARVFRLSPQFLLDLAGLTEPRTLSLRETTVRFAAQPESVAALNEQEREVFEAFMATLTETAK